MGSVSFESVLDGYELRGGAPDGALKLYKSASKLAISFRTSRVSRSWGNDRLYNGRSALIKGELWGWADKKKSKARGRGRRRPVKPEKRRTRNAVVGL